MAHSLGADLTSEGTAPAAVAGALVPAPFPDSPRIIYAKNPLVEVICQLRFPTILRIDSETPAHFQEKIRKEFPLFSEEDYQLLPDLSPEILQLLRAGLQQQAPHKNWKFKSEDEHCEVVLTRESLALTTTSYSRWEEFRDQFVKLLDALQSEYRPSFITRIGLRYQNLIAPSELGFGDVPWSELLQPYIAAEYSSNNLALSSIREAVHRVLIDLPMQGKVNLRHGIAHRQGAEKEPLYLIDNDFFTEEKTEVAGVLDRLNLFNRDSGRLFRWCISERLHEAMGPTTLP